MTDITAGFSGAERIRSQFRRVLAAISRRFVAYAEAKSRIAAIEALESRSDSELAALGLRRDQIVMYVFRDVLYV